jgi:hypothetical protein
LPTLSSFLNLLTDYYPFYYYPNFIREAGLRFGPIYDAFTALLGVDEGKCYPG